MVDGNITPDLQYLDVGVDVSGSISGALQLPTDASGVIQLAGSADVIGRLPPAVVGLGSGALKAIGSVADQVAGAMPAINLIADVASGHAPTDPQQIVPALAATAAVINPLAGAIIGAAGEAMIGLNDLGENLLTSLGFIDNYRSRPAFTYYGFVQKGIPGGIPWGPSHPNWKTWDYWMTPQADGWRWGNLPMSGESYYRQLPFLNIIEALGRYPRSVQGLGPPYDGPVGQNDFETYFFSILKPDLEKWMNANPTISPRDLLRAAAALWKHTHPNPSIGTRVYSPLNVSHAGLNVSEQANPIEVILSSAGDTSDAGAQGAGSDMPPITVNVAPRVSGPRALSPGQAFAQIQQQIQNAMAAAPPKTVISMKGVSAPTPKKTIDLRAASQAIAKGPGYAPVHVVETEASLLSKVLPYAPMAAGVALMPVAGFLAPVGGLAATVLWLWKRKG